MKILKLLERGVCALMDWIAYGRGGRPTDYESAHARAIKAADRLLFFGPILIGTIAVMSDLINSLVWVWFPNFAIILMGFWGLVQTKLYRSQLDVTDKFLKEYIGALEDQKNVLVINRALEQMNTALISDNAMLIAENIRLGGSRQRPDSPTPFGGMTH